MIVKPAVFLAAMLAGSALSASETTQSYPAQGAHETGQTRQAGSEQGRSPATLVVSSPRLSLTLPSVAPVAPKINLTLDNGGYDYSRGR